MSDVFAISSPEATPNPYKRADTRPSPVHLASTSSPINRARISESVITSPESLSPGRQPIRRVAPRRFQLAGGSNSGGRDNSTPLTPLRPLRSLSGLFEDIAADTPQSSERSTARSNRHGRTNLTDEEKGELLAHDSSILESFHFLNRKMQRYS